MKTTIDIPEEELKEAIRYTGSQTKRDAVVQVIADFNRRQRLAELVKTFGTCKNLISMNELRKLRGQN